MRTNGKLSVGSFAAIAGLILLGSLLAALTPIDHEPTGLGSPSTPPMAPAWGGYSTGPPYSITFNASGLPPTASWWVNLGGMNRSSGASAMLLFTMANGSYSFRVGASVPTSVVPGAGLVTVSGAPQFVNESFRVTANSHTVTFQESGLPSTEAWYVNLNGTNLSTLAGQTLQFLVSAGTYPFTVGASGGYVGLAPSGQVTVTTSDQSEAVTFVPAPSASAPPGLSLTFLLWLVAVGLVAALVIGVALRVAGWRRRKREAFRTEARYTRPGAPESPRFPVRGRR
jgi:hypothetical protein